MSDLRNNVHGDCHTEWGEGYSDPLTKNVSSGLTTIDVDVDGALRINIEVFKRLPGSAII